MEIKNENKFKRFCKRYGVLSLACVFSLVVALAVGLSVSKSNEVSTEVISFALPMQNATVVKDYADDRLQFNESLNRWEIHLGVDLTGTDNVVCSIYDGTVTSVDTNSLDGTVVTISHKDGLVSIYSSLDENLNVSVGDSVTKGEQIGIASSTATNESLSGGHLHFVMTKNGEEVDPNIYLDLQNK